MCTTCGCGEGETRIEGDAHDHTHVHRHADGTVHAHPHVHDGDHDHVHGVAHAHEHVHADGTVHVHTHEHDQDHARGHDHAHGHAHEHDHSHVHTHGTADLHYGLGPARSHAPGMTQSRMVQVEEDILAQNDLHAARNRETLLERAIFAVNLVSSPGAGKTTLLVKTIDALRDSLPVYVIEGDQQTTMDADRIRATGAPAIQVNTGKGCHLDASMVARALDRLAPQEGALLMIENVGNLVCPAAFDLGEAHKVVVLSVTEGEDKPLKYPDMFHAASLMVLNKVDLLPYLQFDVQRCLANARRVNPDMTILPVSATTGEGMADWLAWLIEGAQAAREARRDSIDALKRRVADLEAQLAKLRA
jgi:hydrogenase nickel incorporation protein HypB